MQCPNCRASLRTIDYEGVRVETCPSCRGEWLDADELRKVIKLRDVKFDEDKRRAVAEATGVSETPLKDVDRDLPCPKCGGETDAINYGGNTGIIIDRCASCKGFWMDKDDLEKVQMVVEGWEDILPEDLKQHGRKLREIADRMDAEDDVDVSSLPLVGGLVNSIINGYLDYRL